MKKFGIDPVYNEEMMIAAIVQPQNEHEHSSGVLTLLIDAWDRKITRDEFVTLAASVLNCADRIARHSMMYSVGQFLEAKKVVTPADIEVTLASTREQLVASTEEVRTMARRVAQMATSKDPIN